MIRFQYGEEQYKQTLIEMWKLCFPEDTLEFRTFYFDKVYRHEETLIALEDGQPIASLQMIPYQIKLEDPIFPAAYISGAMTHPNYQRKGYMGELLKYALEEMNRKRVPITFLIPQEEWLFDFYTKYGYKKAFPWYSESISTQQVNPGKTGKNSLFLQYKSMEEIDLETLYTIYSGFLNRKKQVVLKTKQQFRNILEDLFIEDGTVFAGENEIALSIPGETENTVKLKECFCKNEIKQVFLSSIAYSSGKKEIIELNSTSGSFSHYWGMIRILDESITISGDIYMNTMLD
ncbi:MAG: GNAT family N-acetyltransferase [Dysgonamonadaceae bacterium]|jgi:predicted acetyltransferase|nr:GNAT family N-acetyltransferase [Dysgonamonadaceae bacterium]